MTKAKKRTAKVPDRFTPDEFGMDELVLSGVTVHIERMDDNHIWMGISRGSQYIALGFHARGAIRVNPYDDRFGLIKPEPTPRRPAR